MKLAEIGDIVLDKFLRPGTVIASTSRSLTIKYAASTMKYQYNPKEITPKNSSFRIVEKHYKTLERHLGI